MGQRINQTSSLGGTRESSGRPAAGRPGKDEPGRPVQPGNVIGPARPVRARPAVLTTDMVKYELSRVPVGKLCCRTAEISATLRFAGQLRVTPAGCIVEAYLYTAAVARRLQEGITATFGYPASLHTLQAVSRCTPGCYLVRVGNPREGRQLARRTGLLDGQGRPVRGLPWQLISRRPCDCAAAWRGAFLARGSLSAPDRSTALTITCPAYEVALALAGAVRRIGVTAQACDSRGTNRVVLTDRAGITGLLARLGAHEAAGAWESLWAHRRALVAAAARQVNPRDSAAIVPLGLANARRGAEAAAIAAARAQRALDILGSEAPGHLVAAGQLRVAHRQLSLRQLGQLADPPVTKDVVASRVRSLIALANLRAAEHGVPGTEACLFPEANA